jgi:DNA repair protein RadA/Sms
MAIDEPACDLAIVAAVASSLRNRPVRPSTVVFGEIGLAGEVRAIPQGPLRVKEAAQMGFGRCVLPLGNCPPADVPPGCELIEIRQVAQALDELLVW